MSKAAELAALISSQTALSNRNLVINGAMQVAQRATEVTGVTDSGYKAVDRWQNQTGTLGTFTMSQSTTSPDGFAFSQKYDCTTADASPASTDFLIFQHRIEAQNLQHLQYGTSDAKSVTLSFHVRSNKTGTYVIEVYSPDTGKHIAKTYTIDSANTWEKKTLTFVGDTASALDNDNARSLEVIAWLGAGSNYNSGTLPSTWTTLTNANRCAGQTVNLADNTSNEFFITGVQFEVGDTATDFEHRSFGEELSLCQRYFERFTGCNTHAGLYNGSDYLGQLFYKVTKRTRPTFANASGAYTALFNASGGDLGGTDNMYFTGTNANYIIKVDVDAEL